jgi:hypothetical protein
MYEDVVNGKAWAIGDEVRTQDGKKTRWKGNVQGSQDGLECENNEVSQTTEMI